MHSPKVEVLCYALAAGFIFVIAFHSPAKVSVAAADAPVAAAALSAK
jgi:hypothetical protein